MSEKKWVTVTPKVERDRAAGGWCGRSAELLQLGGSHCAVLASHGVDFQRFLKKVVLPRKMGKNERFPRHAR